jgi:tRNA threonylcarbamoyladenosine biosynthesis protein TsaB
MPMCKSVLESANKSLQDVERIAVSYGAGSYTGLRIGISAVKSMCYALGIGCNGVSTLESLAYNVFGFNGTICSIMKARLDLVYYGIFQSDMKTIQRTADDGIISKAQLFDILNAHEGNVILVGDGAEDFYHSFECKPNVVLSATKDRLQSASSLCEIAKLRDAESPYDLEALYLQPTRAEKELQEGKV